MKQHLERVWLCATHSWSTPQIVTHFFLIMTLWGKYSNYLYFRKTKEQRGKWSAQSHSASKQHWHWNFNLGSQAPSSGSWIHCLLPCDEFGWFGFQREKQNKSPISPDFKPNPDSLIVEQGFGHSRARDADPGMFMAHPEGHPWTWSPPPHHILIHKRLYHAYCSALASFF